MGGIQAYKTKVKRGGTATSFSDEAMSAESSLVYAIDDTSKQVWNRESSAEVIVSDDGSSVGSSTYSANYLFGKVTFNSAPSGDVTVSGEYIPVSSAQRIAYCNDHTLAIEANLLDDTGYKEAQDNGGNRTRDYGIQDSNVSLSRFQDGDKSLFKEALDNREAVLVEIQPGGLGLKFRGWYKIESDTLSGSVDDLESDDISLQLDDLRTSGGDHVNFGWNA